MRYVCLNCGARFELDAAGTPASSDASSSEDAGEEKTKAKAKSKGKAKNRCPKCLRVTGIEKVSEAQSPSSVTRDKPWLVPAAVVVLLGAIAGGYAYWRGSTPLEVGEEVPERPLTADELAGHMRRLRVDARGVVELLVADDAIEEMAQEATEGRRDAFAQAEGIQAAIRARASAHAFDPWSLGVPRETPLAPAATVHEWLQEDGARRRLYPLEAAALAVAALRSRGVPAMVAEIWRFPGDRSPPDTSGHFGYFGVAVFEAEAGEGDPRIYDPYRGREVEPESGDYAVLTDVEALGAALNIRAIHLLAREGEPERALELSTLAVRMHPRSPSVRAVRGAILLSAGNAPEGMAEFESAAQIRRDAPRLNLLASMHMAQQQLDEARRELSAALDETPDYAAARATLAAVHIASGDMDLARAELETAARLDPDLHVLPGLWAMYYASTGDLDRAVASARESVERNPADIQQRLTAARIYRQAARYDDMRREAREVLERTPSSRRDQMEDLIQRLLGSTALEAPLDEEDLDEDDEDWDDWEPSSGGLQLGGGSGGGLQLGGGSPGGGLQLGGAPSGGPSLGGGMAPASGSGEPLLMLPDPSTLHLGGGSDLSLDLEDDEE